MDDRAGAFQAMFGVTPRSNDMDGVIGSNGVVIEIAGGHHARFRARSDEWRTRWLERHGFRVVCIPDGLVLGRLALGQPIATLTVAL